MNDKAFRATYARCHVCAARCTGWVCLSCALGSGYWSARHADDRPAPTATRISRSQQQTVDREERIEFVGRDSNQDHPRFTREELDRWDANLAKLDPGHSARLRQQWKRAA